MNTLTKEQMQKLTPEQQEAFASMIASDTRSRQELLKQARQHGWWSRTAAGIFCVALITLAVYQVDNTRLLFGCIVLLVILMQIRVAELHQRLDTVLKLLHPLFTSTTENRNDDEKDKRRAG